MGDAVSVADAVSIADVPGVVDESAAVDVPSVDSAMPAPEDTPATPAPVAVFAEKAFDVKVTEDVVFGQGLTHTGWQDGAGQPMDLTLDVFEPIGHDATSKPVVVVIHGGGFVSGSSKHKPLTAMATTFAERGWVGFSIEYRLAKDHGTLPATYPPIPAPNAREKAQNQWRALYPACRDAKAAIRWIRAHADEYGIDTDYITAIGGSAGSFIAVALAATDDADCSSEVDAQDDPTLASTHLDQSSAVATVIDHWGGLAVVSMLEAIGGAPRFDAADAPMSIVHGTDDPTVSFSEAEELKAIYDSIGVPYAYYPLEGAAHGPWGAEVDGKSLVTLAYDFIVEQQSLVVQ